MSGVDYQDLIFFASFWNPKPESGWSTGSRSRHSKVVVEKKKKRTRERERERVKNRKHAHVGERSRECVRMDRRKETTLESCDLWCKNSYVLAKAKVLSFGRK